MGYTQVYISPGEKLRARAQVVVTDVRPCLDQLSVMLRDYKSALEITELERLILAMAELRSATLELSEVIRTRQRQEVRT